MRSYTQYIDGKDVEGDRWTYVVRASAMLRDTDAAFNLKRALELGRPAELTEDVVARCSVGSVADSDRALEAARRASRIFRLFPQETRSQIVIEFNETLAARAEEMIEILMVEGHPRRLAQWEVSGMVCATDEATIRWYETQLYHSFESQGRRLELVRKPDGVVCVNPPQNAAGSNSTLGVFSLLVGNAIVVKAPRSSPLSVMFLFRDILAPILDKYGAPPGTMNLVCGNAGGILRSWVNSPLVDDILFFGDTPAGLKLGEECLKNGKKAILELAGNDGFVVWRDADLDAAARALEECFYGFQPDLHGSELRDRPPGSRRQLSRAVPRTGREASPGVPGGSGDPAEPGAQVRSLLRLHCRSARGRRRRSVRGQAGERLRAAVD